MTLGTVILAAALCPAAEPTATPPEAKLKIVLQYCPTPSGFIAGMMITSEAQKFYDLAPLLKLNRYDPENMADSKAAAVPRPPAPGKIYAIFTAAVFSQRSLGKHDYLLHTGPDDYRCLAIGTEGEVFDQRTVEIRNKSLRADSTLRVAMVYEIPEDAAKANFTPAAPLMSPGDFTAVEFPLPDDSNPKAAKKKTVRATAAVFETVTAPTAPVTVAAPATPATPATPAAPVAAPAAESTPKTATATAAAGNDKKTKGAGKEQTPERTLLFALALLEKKEYDKFAKSFISKKQQEKLPANPEARLKEIARLTQPLLEKLRALKDTKPELQDDGKTAVFSDGGKHQLTFVKNPSNSWRLTSKK